MPDYDARIRNVAVSDVSDSLIVDLVDGRTIIAPLAWFPRLNADPAKANDCQICGGGMGIHWPELDEDISVKSLLHIPPEQLD
jgi:hypothetical protein